MKNVERTRVTGCCAAWLVLIFASTSFSDEGKASLMNPRIVMPRSVMEQGSYDSELVVLELSSRKILRPILDAGEAAFETEGKEVVILEIEKRDEESWNTSVFNAWVANDTTRSIARKIDLRDRFRAGLKLSGFPEGARFVEFCQVFEGGPKDWICVYQAIVKGMMFDDVFAPGIWACIPLDQSGRRMADARLINISMARQDFEFRSLLKCPEAIMKKLIEREILDPICEENSPVDNDPFRGADEENRSNDPFE